jgi:uroporphyrinogen decarboxylase
MEIMNSRKLVKDTLEYGSPARIPRNLWTLPWAQEHFPDELARIQERFPDDTTTSPGFLRQPPRVSGSQYKTGTFIDEWGCIFESVHSGVIGEVKIPFLQNWEQLDNLHTPDEFFTVDIDQVNAFCRQTDRFVFAGACPRPFERAQFLRRSDNLYMDIADNLDSVKALLHKLHEFYLKELEIWVHTEVDAVNFMDDWGTQRSLLISPHLWRQVFKPLYKDYIDLAHAHGKYIFMHSDGYTTDIIPDLIELGLDAFNTQIFCMDIEDLGQKHAGMLTFWGEIDRQHLLPFGSTADIRTAVQRVYNAFYRQGGVIAQCEFSAGTQPANVYTVFKTWEALLR